MSAETGIAPQALLALDGDMFDAIREAAARRWTAETELLAAQLEVAHAHLAAFARVHGRRGARPLEPLRVPRPEPPHREQEPAGSSRRVSIAEFADMFPEAVNDAR